MHIPTAQVMNLLQNREEAQVAIVVYFKDSAGLRRCVFWEKNALIMGVDHDLAGGFATVQGGGRRRQTPTQGNEPAHTERMGSKKM